MMKGFFFLFFVSMCAAVMSLAAALNARADGMIFDKGSTAPVMENEQRVAAILGDGRQSMVIAVSLEGTGKHKDKDDKGSAWIFPVLGSPEEVKVDVVDSFPAMFNRGDIEKRFTERFMACAAGPTYTSLICVPVLVPYYLSYKRGLPRGPYIEVDKWGIHVETVAAESLDELGTYLKERGLEVKPKQLESFSAYCSEKHTFIIAWLASHKEMIAHFGEEKDRPLGRRPCLFVDYPASKGFYPLVPTSGYGNRQVKVVVYLFGHVSVDTGGIPARLRDLPPPKDEPYHIRTNYFIGGSYKVPNRGEWLDTMPEKLGKRIPKHPYQYTRVVIDGPADALVSDLTFTNDVPSIILFKTKFYSYYYNWGFYAAFVIGLTGLYSYIASGLTGVMLYRRWRPYALLGLWNILTMPVLSYVVGRYRSRAGHEPVGRVKFIVLFFVVFNTLVVLGMLFLSSAIDTMLDLWDWATRVV